MARLKITVGLENYTHWARNTFMTPGNMLQGELEFSPSFFGGGGRKGIIAANSNLIIPNFTKTGLALVCFIIVCHRLLVSLDKC